MEEKILKSLSLKISYLDYISIGRNFSDDINNLLLLSEKEDINLYDHKLFKVGYIEIKPNDKRFDLLISYCKTRVPSIKLIEYVLNDISLLPLINNTQDNKVISTPGFIYVIKSNRLYKIGKTIDLKSRERKYITENPFGIELVYSKLVSDYSKYERKLLDHFKDKLILGNEWFKLTDKDLTFIKQYEI